MSWNGTVRCTWCGARGHNRRSCGDRKSFVATNPDSYEARRDATMQSRQATRECSYCHDEGHNRRTCVTLKEDKVLIISRLATSRAAIAKSMVANGLGIGTLVNVPFNWSGDLGPALVINFDWVDVDDFNSVQGVATFVEDGTKRYCDFRFEGSTHKITQGEILSSLDEDMIRARFPKDWLTGTNYQEEKYFPKGESRSIWRFPDVPEESS